jgi:hypothetical protein
VGPTDREWRRGSHYKGDGEGVLVHGEKEGRGYGGRWRGFFIICGDEKGELLKLLLHHQTTTPSLYYCVV